MPTLDELQKISDVTGALDPKISAAMRVIFLLTEQDSQYMNDYIAVAVGLKPELSDTVRAILYPYHLVDDGGSIPLEIRQAVCRAVDMRYLEVRDNSHKIRCSRCGGPHKTESHHYWFSKAKYIFSDDVYSDLARYAFVLDAFKRGGMVAVDHVLYDAGFEMNHNSCFCGSSEHSRVAHLRWLIDVEHEL